MKKAPATSGSDGGARASTATSRSLLARVQDNEADAWDRLIVLYTPLVLHWCRRMHLQDQDAADVLQEVFQSVASHIGAFRKEKPSDTFRGWLRIITRNKIHDHFRRRGREPAGVGGSEAQHRLAQVAAAEPLDECDPAEKQAERLLFERAMDGIRREFEERTWKAFWRTAVDGLTPKDAAAELGMSSGAVRVAKSRVLHRLRAELGDLHT